VDTQSPILKYDISILGTK